MKRKERLALEKAEREAAKAEPCPNCKVPMKSYQGSMWCGEYMKRVGYYHDLTDDCRHVYSSN